MKHSTYIVIHFEKILISNFNCLIVPSAAFSKYKKSTALKKKYLLHSDKYFSAISIKDLQSSDFLKWNVFFKLIE